LTTASRLCIDRLRVRQRERELYSGPWLPEPWLDREPPPADRQAELADDLSLAFLALLERLAPEERAAFLLREVFECDYARIAALLGRSEAACRQVVHRASERVRRERQRFQTTDTARRQLLERFAAVVTACDENELLTLFAPDATWTADGGGKKAAANRVLRGRRVLARLAAGLARKNWRDATLHIGSLNGESAVLIERGGSLHSTLAIATDGISILAVYSIVNPDKLGLSTAD